jgi:hypothetical protein
MCVDVFSMCVDVFSMCINVFSMCVNILSMVCNGRFLFFEESLVELIFSTVWFGSV